MMKYTVKWFNDPKGYGFINYNGEDAFVHYTQIVSDGYKTLKENDVVEVGSFIKTEKGYQAKNVRKVN